MPLSGLIQDVRYALRGFRQAPGFVAVIIVSIGLGIAANTTIFTMVNKVLLGDLAVQESDRLVSIVTDGGTTVPYGTYTDYRDQLGTVFTDVAAHFPLVPASLAEKGNPERVWGQFVSGNYFDVTGVKFTQGRGFLAREDEAMSRDAVVVLSSSLWQRRFAADPSIIGKTIGLNEQRFTVVGIAPAGFHGTDRMVMADFWVPIHMTIDLMPELGRDGGWDKRDNDWLLIDARLKPGVSRQQALAAINTVQSRIDKEYRKDNQKTQMSLQTAGTLPGEARSAGIAVMTMLMVVGALVLLIACANVANLLLARAVGRQKEIGIRLALGASRMRLIRQLLVESVLMATGGAVFGYLLAIWASASLSQMQLSLPFPIDFTFKPDARVFLYTVGMTVITGLLFGLMPAIRASRPDIVSAIRDTAISITGSRRFGLRNMLVVLQVALSLVLVIGSGLFLRSLQNASSVDLGMHPGNVLSLSFDPTHVSKTPGVFIQQVRERIATLPGVTAVGMTDVVPLSLGGAGGSVNRPGDAEKVQSDVFHVSPGFFETMGITMLRGHDFATGDRPGIRSAIINEAMAAKMFPTSEAMGQQIEYKQHQYEVIGVFKNVKMRTIGEEARPAIFASLEQDPDSMTSLFGVTLLVKTAGQPEGLSLAVRREISAMAPNIAIFNEQTMQQHFDRAFLLPRLSATLFGIFGTVGLTLAMIGLYGVMSFSVRRRTKEIGIRVALGADRFTVLKMITSQGLTLTLIGVLCGLPLAFGLGRALSSVLYGISPTDLVTFIGIPVLLLLVGLAASLIPARRAARVDPMVALRYE